MVISVLTSAVALSLAKVSQGSIHSVKATQLATQSEQYALGQAAILKATNYDDLAAQSRQVIQNSNGYFSEVTLSAESDYAENVKRRIASINIYKGNEDLPRYSLQVLKTDAEVQASGGGVPIGTIIAWPSTSTPTEGGTWLLCDGRSCSAYPKLVALIGSTVPNLHGRFLEGTKNTDVRSIKEAGLPNITGLRQATWGGADGGAGGYGSTKHTGAFYPQATTSCAATVDESNWVGSGSGFGFDASRSNPIYGASSTVQPKSYTVRYYIKAD